MKILLIEDEAPMVELWKIYLEPVGADIVTATTFAEAKAEMEKIPPPDMVFLDLVLPDSRMPDETLRRGIAMLHEINPAAVIIVLTGIESVKIAQLAMSLGADAFRNKHDVVGQLKLLDAVRGALKDRKKSPQCMAESCIALLETLDGLLGKV